VPVCKVLRHRENAEIPFRNMWLGGYIRRSLNLHGYLIDANFLVP